jgi:hypothetical protein
MSTRLLCCLTQHRAHKSVNSGAPRAPPVVDLPLAAGSRAGTLIIRLVYLELLYSGPLEVVRPTLPASLPERTAASMSRSRPERRPFSHGKSSDIRFDGYYDRGALEQQSRPHGHALL